MIEQAPHAVIALLTAADGPIRLKSVSQFADAVTTTAEVKTDITSKLTLPEGELLTVTADLRQAWRAASVRNDAHFRAEQTRSITTPVDEMDFDAPLDPRQAHALREVWDQKAGPNYALPDNWSLPASMIARLNREFVHRRHQPRILTRIKSLGNPNQSAPFRKTEPIQGTDLAIHKVIPQDKGFPIQDCLGYLSAIRVHHYGMAQAGAYSVDQSDPNAPLFLQLRPLMAQPGLRRKQ